MRKDESPWSYIYLCTQAHTLSCSSPQGTARTRHEKTQVLEDAGHSVLGASSATTQLAVAVVDLVVLGVVERTESRRFARTALLADRGL
jgi:hypothetical protein